MEAFSADLNTTIHFLNSVHSMSFLQNDRRFINMPVKLTWNLTYSSRWVQTYVTHRQSAQKVLQNWCSLAYGMGKKVHFVICHQWAPFWSLILGLGKSSTLSGLIRNKASNRLEYHSWWRQIAWMILFRSKVQIYITFKTPQKYYELYITSQDNLIFFSTIPIC